MWIYGALAIPVLIATIVAIKFPRRVTIKEYAVMFAVPIILIVIAKAVAEKSLTNDTEFWGGWAKTATYYERWNEKGACLHPKMCTDSKGNSYPCGTLHAYDVYSHPERWEVVDSNGFEYDISKQHWLNLVKRFGNKKFKDMKRKFHTIDGDAHVATYKGPPNRIEMTSCKKTYENRVQASDTVFSFVEVDPKEKKLFEYPKITKPYHQVCVLGDVGPHNQKYKWNMEYINATLGKKCKARIYLLAWKNRDMQAALDQQNYWKNGNKNEIVINVGLDNDYNVTWSYVFGWTMQETLKAFIRDTVSGMKKLDLKKIADAIYPEIKPLTIRRDFKEFNYVTVSPPMWAVILVYLLTIAVSVGISVWAVTNYYTN